MTRELRRLLIEPSRLAADGETLELLPTERRYLERVLRFRRGDRLAVVDGTGHLWSAVLGEGGRLRLEQGPDAPLESEGAPALELELAMAVPKREAETVWRMATELGADRLQPLLARHGVRTGPPPRERWAAVVREAVEQCERLWRPVLLEPAEAEGWLAAGPQDVGLLATPRRAGLASLAQELERVAARRVAVSRVTLAIGPEGGWGGEEERLAEAAGWIPVSLGAPILRTPTAAVAGLAMLSSWRALGA
jgi:16S rRNA (uracil1498-N3)-methyltransferase